MASSRWMIALETAVLAAVSLAAFYPTLEWMWGRFAEPDSFYSHGPLILPLAALVAWIRRDRSAGAASGGGRACGLAITAVALAIHCLAISADINILSGYAMVAAIYGACLYLWGRQRAGNCAPAAVLLLLMVPLPRVLLVDVAFFLQMASAKMTAALLNAFGMGVAREGISLLMPGGAVVEVGRGCSGLRSIIVFMTVAWAIIALAPRRNLPGSALLLLIALPMGVASNVLRLAVTALAGGVPGWRDPVHTAAGVGAFIAYTAVMTVIGRALLWKRGS